MQVSFTPRPLYPQEVVGVTEAVRKLKHVSVPAGSQSPVCQSWSPSCGHCIDWATIGVEKHWMNSANNEYARSQAFTAVELNFFVSWDITRRKVVKPTFRDYLSVPFSGAWPIGSPETPVLNHLTPRNNPEDVRMWICLLYILGCLFLVKK
jgi:hypothetical protein